MIQELSEFASEQQRRFDAITSPSERKERGHFGTSPAIAAYMAGMFEDLSSTPLRVLDPGAGVGTLSAAVVQRVLMQGTPRRLEFELWENDPSLTPLLQATMARCRAVLRECGHEMEYSIRTEDFVLSNRPGTLFESGPTPSFDLAILNPPYFKLRKESPHAQAMKHVVHGQPNIYSLFMAVAAELLVEGGELVAITPRSYFNGPYFNRFRKWFFDKLTVRHIHLFESRMDAFKSDSVLQENVILLARKGADPADVQVTSSRGPGFAEIESSSAAYDKIIDNSHGDHVVRVSTSRRERQIIDAMDRLEHRFRDTEFGISTGPVVTFRATEYLRTERTAETAPLIWMHNVRPFTTRNGQKNGKPGHILAGLESRKLLLPATTYVLLKRFTAKEEKRRLVAGVITREDSYSDWLGIENHLNYVYRRGTSLSRFDALGLAGYFNSVAVDLYFRAISGNTQVNAAEIRAMPLPSVESITRLGEEIDGIEDRDPAIVEGLVGAILNLPADLIEELIEAGR